MASSFDHMRWEIERYRDQFKHIFDSSAVRMLQEVQLRSRELTAHFLDSAWHVNQTLDRIKSINESVANSVQAFEATKQMLHSGLEVDKIVRDIQAGFSFVDFAAKNSLGQLVNIQALQAVTAMLPASLNLFGGLGYDSMLRSRAHELTFSDELRHHLEELDATGADDESAVAALRLIAILFVSRCASLIRDPTHFYGMLGILLTILFAIKGSIDGEQMESRLAGQVRATEQRLMEAREQSTRTMVEALERLRPQQAVARQRVIIRQTILRERPDGKSHLVRVIYPNEVVEQLDAKGTWIQIRAFDYTRGEATTGWVLKKYTTLARD